MRLRKLENKDAGYMLEWMHDDNVVSNLAGNFASKQLEDCLAFIESSQDTSSDLNLAIVDESDEYMGTVSLKHINQAESFAEFAIAIRATAMGKGFSKYAMQEIIRIGKEDYRLERIYWCVATDNHRAVRFYDKNGYQRVENIPDSLKNLYSKKQLASFYWYQA